MRGKSPTQTSLVTLATPGDVVPKQHPLRMIKKLADAALAELSGVFDEMYASGGRPSVPPERLLKAMLLVALYGIRSERMLCEQLRYNLLFKWFLDMDMTDEPFDQTTFGKNRDRILKHEVAALFFRAVVEQARKKRLMSSEHFSVDGTLIEAWASMKSYRRKDDDDKRDGNGWADFKGEKRSNETHASRTDPQSRLMRKGYGKEAKLSYCLNALMENRNGLLAGIQVDLATGTAERTGALNLIDDHLDGTRRVTLAADKGYDVRSFVDGLKRRNVTPHVAQNISVRRGSAIDKRTTRHDGYRISSRCRRKIEGIFGWMKAAGHFRKTRYRGQDKTNLCAVIMGAAYNLLRMSKLLEQAA